MVVMLCADGEFAYAYNRGISAEDLRHELITAANKIRNMMEAKHEGR
jgi:hypothetical protein